METDTATRYRSRILREMNANRDNPFNSPPSSTGSHRAASPTLSSVFSDPEGESTRRLNEDIARVTAPRKLPVNWEAAHRKWPEFYSMPQKNNLPIFDDNTDTRPMSAHPKENKPLTHTSAPLITKFLDDNTTQDAWEGSKRTRAEMQPRVDNESDLSSILSKSPARGLSTYGLNKNLHVPSPLSKSHTKEPLETASHHQRRGSISEALERLRRASASPKPTEHHHHDQSSPNMSSAKSSLTAVPLPLPQ
ncbi:hypothetical protein PT974_05965 [Cladobotryum mycophilum]|uniref:Uncharacterized protein n=1 Tax=Cladobotryum mycophilum TaxID=491253 RepID=A0ABR0SKX6_9HYPO